MVAASSDEPSLNPFSEPSLVPSIQSKLRAIFEAICDLHCCIPMSLQEPIFQELNAVQVIGSPFKSIFSSFFQWF